MACSGVALASRDKPEEGDGASEALVEAATDAETPSDCEDAGDAERLVDEQSDGDGDRSSDGLRKAVVLGIGDVPSVPEERGVAVAVSVGVADGCDDTDGNVVLDGNGEVVAESDTTRLVKGERKGVREGVAHADAVGTKEVLGAELTLADEVPVPLSDDDDVSEGVSVVEAVTVPERLESDDAVASADAVLRAVPVTPPPAPPRPELAVAAATDCERLADAWGDSRGETLEVADGDAVADAQGEALGQEDTDELPESVDDGVNVPMGVCVGNGDAVPTDDDEALREPRDEAEPVLGALRSAETLGDPVGEGDGDVEDVADALCVGDGDEDGDAVVVGVLDAESVARLAPVADARELRERDRAPLREGVGDTVPSAEAVDESIDDDVAVSAAVALELDDALMLGEELGDPDGLPDPDGEGVRAPERVAARVGAGFTVVEGGRGVPVRGGVCEAEPAMVADTDGDGERVVCGESVTSMDVPLVPDAPGEWEADDCSDSDGREEGDKADTEGDSDWRAEKDTD